MLTYSVAMQAAFMLTADPLVIWDHRQTDPTGSAVTFSPLSVQFMAFLGHAIDLNCSQFRSGLFSAKGTVLCQPRVERRESANVAKPWDVKVISTGIPKGWP